MHRWNGRVTKLEHAVPVEPTHDGVLVICYRPETETPAAVLERWGIDAAEYPVVQYRRWIHEREPPRPMFIPKYPPPDWATVLQEALRQMEARRAQKRPDDGV
jgi:hypothetical protein